MNARRKILLGVLGVIALLQGGDWLVNSVIQGPLQARRGRTAQLTAEIRKREATLAETRKSAGRMNEWLQQSLPADPEVARSSYRNWLMTVVRQAGLRNAVVDSGSATVRRGRNRSVMYRTLPFTLRARGALTQFNQFLFAFTAAGHLHRISGFSLTPVSGTGQFDVAISIETVLLAARKATELNSGASRLMAADNPAHYAPIVQDNLFGVGLNPADPMQHTLVSAITFSNGRPLVWITEQLTDKVTQVEPGQPFETVALAGKVLSATEREVIVESSGEQLSFVIGKPFSEATRISQPAAQ